MTILIHAVPERLWYVENFLVPALKEQGAEDVQIWNDDKHSGNLKACMDCFASMEGDGDTWHIQDDVLVCRDFVDRCKSFDEGVVYGFCCLNFNDRPEAAGRVYAFDAWNSFQCIRIPNAYARECAAWVRSERWRGDSPHPELPILWQLNKGDDTFFHEFMACKHGRETVYNAAPNLVNHIDYLIGGSTLSHSWTCLALSALWDDKELVAELKEKIRVSNFNTK